MRCGRICLCCFLGLLLGVRVLGGMGDTDWWEEVAVGRQF